MKKKKECTLKDILHDRCIDFGTTVEVTGPGVVGWHYMEFHMNYIYSNIIYYINKENKLKQREWWFDRIYIKEIQSTPHSCGRVYMSVEYVRHKIPLSQKLDPFTKKLKKKKERWKVRCIVLREGRGGKMKKREWMQSEQIHV